MKIKTIPNLVTLLRLILIPIIIYLIFSGKTKQGIFLFIFAVLLDKLDGVLARKLKQATYFGGMFDALTDTILIFSTIFSLYLKNIINLDYLWILILPKIITFILLVTINKRKYKATIFSRCTSLLLYIIIPMFLLDFHETTIKILIL